MQGKHLYGRGATAGYRAHMKTFGTIALAISVGLVTAVVLFMLTAPIVGGCCSRVAVNGDRVIARTSGGVNAWTGEVTLPTTTSIDGATGKAVTEVRELAEDQRNYRVVPFPVGFAIGSLMTLAVITVARRPRGGALASHVSPA